MDKGVVSVEDLESANGTFINGKRVLRIETVYPGDRLSLGAVHFRVEYEAPPGARKRPSRHDDVPLLEVADEVEVVDDSDALPEVLEVEDALPVAEPIEDLEPVDDDFVVLEPQEQINLGDDDEFLIDLDDTDDRSKR
jgi:hypothetical protein